MDIACDSLLGPHLDAFECLISSTCPKCAYEIFSEAAEGPFHACHGIIAVLLLLE